MERHDDAWRGTQSPMQRKVRVEYAVHACGVDALLTEGMRRWA